MTRFWWRTEAGGLPLPMPMRFPISSRARTRLASFGSVSSMKRSRATSTRSASHAVRSATAARRHRARGDRQLARTAAAQRGLGNARPVAALVTRVPRANARWCVPQRLRDGAAAGREHCVPRAVRALHCAIAFPPSLPIRCVGDNDDRSIRRGGAWHRPRRAVGSSCSARHAIRAWRQTNEETTGDRDRGLHVAAPRRRWRRRW